VRKSHPVGIDTGDKHRTHQALRQGNLSGDDGDFSISSMSGSSHRGNKSTLNNTTTGVGAGNFGRIFSKNYFVDGEKLMRHISPSQPTRSPRDSGTEDAASNHCINILKLNEQEQPQTVLSVKR